MIDSGEKRADPGQGNWGVQLPNGGGLLRSLKVIFFTCRYLWIITSSFGIVAVHHRPNLLKLCLIW